MENYAFFHDFSGFNPLNLMLNAASCYHTTGPVLYITVKSKGTNANSEYLLFHPLYYMDDDFHLKDFELLCICDLYSWLM